MKKAFLLLAFLLMLLGFAIYEAVTGRQMADVHLSWQAYIPLMLGVIGTLLLAGVLVGLLIYSNRKGYDRPWD